MHAFYKTYQLQSQDITSMHSFPTPYYFDILFTLGSTLTLSGGGCGGGWRGEGVCGFLIVFFFSRNNIAFTHVVCLVWGPKIYLS